MRYYLKEELEGVAHHAQGLLRQPQRQKRLHHAFDKAMWERCIKDVGTSHPWLKKTLHALAGHSDETAHVTVHRANKEERLRFGEATTERKFLVLAFDVPTADSSNIDTKFFFKEVEHSLHLYEIFASTKA